MILGHCRTISRHGSVLLGGSAYVLGLPTSTPEAGQLLPGEEATAAFTSTTEARSESAGPVTRQVSEKQGLRRGQIRTAAATGQRDASVGLQLLLVLYVSSNELPQNTG